MYTYESWMRRVAEAKQIGVCAVEVLLFPLSIRMEDSDTMITLQYIASSPNDSYEYRRRLFALAREEGFTVERTSASRALLSWSRVEDKTNVGAQPRAN
jgi:hypothetical protein